MGIEKNKEVETTEKQVKSKTPKVDKEKEELKNIIEKQEQRIKEQDNQLLEIKQQLDLLLKGSLINSYKEDKKTKRTIKFVNMTSGGFTIRGNRLYHLDKQFDSISFSESEAKTIIANMPQSIANGFLYIADKDFVEECELDGVYETLIDEKTLRNLLNNDSSEVCNIYKNASDEQKKIIVDMIINKKINKEPVDANILVELGNLCGQKLIDIEPLDEE